MRIHLTHLSKVRQISPILATNSLLPWEGTYETDDALAVQENDGQRVMVDLESGATLISAHSDGDDIHLRHHRAHDNDLGHVIAALGLARQSQEKVDLNDLHHRITSIDHAWCLMRALRTSVPQDRLLSACEALLTGAKQWEQLRLAHFNADGSKKEKIEQQVEAFTKKAQEDRFGAPGVTAVAFMLDPRGSAMEIRLEGRDAPLSLCAINFNWQPSAVVDLCEKQGPAKAPQNRYSVRPTKLAPDVLGVLNDVLINGNCVRIAQQLDAKLYGKVNELFNALGGHWHTGQSAHVFDQDPRPLITKAIVEEAIYTDRDYEFFPTQAPQVRRMLARAELEPGMLVLEPHAGDGALALAAAQIVGKHAVTCYELMPRNVASLQEAGFSLESPTDFLAVEPEMKYDVVLANPPFSGGRDIVHLTHAMKFLKPGGKLVAIASTTWRHGTHKAASDFQALLKSRGAVVEEIEAGAFHAVGTDVATTLITLRMPTASVSPKPAAAPNPKGARQSPVVVQEEHDQFALF